MSSVPVVPPAEDSVRFVQDPLPALFLRCPHDSTIRRDRRGRLRHGRHARLLPPPRARLPRGRRGPAARRGRTARRVPAGDRHRGDGPFVSRGVAAAGRRGGRMSLAFGCDGPAEVDSVYEDLVGAGYHGELKPWDAFWGCGTRSCTTRTAMASTCSRRYPRPSSSPAACPPTPVRPGPDGPDRRSRSGPPSPRRGPPYGRGRAPVAGAGRGRGLGPVAEGGQ